MVALTINNQKVEVEEGATLLRAVEKVGITIPTLCYHESLSSFGSCRLCTVEVIVKEVSKLATACTYPAEEGIEVKTNSPKALEARQIAMELLLAKCPGSKKIQSLAKEMGIEKPSFKVEEKGCILCGLCLRACYEIADVDAITFIARGLNRGISEPFIEVTAAKCIACGSCAYLCPTNFIKMKDVDDTRIIWDRVFKMKRCKICGNYFAPEAQLEYIRKKVNLPQDFFDSCPNCK